MSLQISLTEAEKAIQEKLDVKWSEVGQAEQRKKGVESECAALTNEKATLLKEVENAKAELAKIKIELSSKNTKLSDDQKRYITDLEEREQVVSARLDKASASEEAAKKALLETHEVQQKTLGKVADAKEFLTKLQSTVAKQIQSAIDSIGG